MASTGEVWRLGYRPALDGVRGIAVLLVVAGHASPGTLIAGGSVGVSVFFVLSGFLISALLLQEQDRRGRINLRAFYMRRALRLLPALVLFLVVMSIVAWVTGDARYATVGRVVAVIFYVANWVAVTSDLGGLGHTWSLAVEEQFYLVFPLVVLVFRRHQRALLYVLGAAIVGSMLVRLSLWPGDYRMYFRTDVNAAALLIGCLIAVVMRRWSRPVDARWLMPAGLVCLVALTCSGRDASWFLTPLLAPLAAALVVYSVAVGRRSAWMESRALTLVGRRSYGLYLWHFPLLWAVQGELDRPLWLTTPLMLAAAWLMTLLSWHLVEAPFLRLKGRSLAPARAAPVPAEA